ncbi:MAG: 50S ribosomal protein L20 [Planctomycetes bacterium]|nr:50S ribosomal protein L20 [Planctomycetota bacterium]
MVRARSGKTVTQGRKRHRKLTKGFRQSRHNLYRQSLVTLIRARRYAFRDRRVRKREFRRLWIARVNAACRMRGLRYSQLIHGLQLANVELNRQTLAEIAIADPPTFDKIAELAKTKL